MLILVTTLATTLMLDNHLLQHAARNRAPSRCHITYQPFVCSQPSARCSPGLLFGELGVSAQFHSLVVGVPDIIALYDSLPAIGRSDINALYGSLAILNNTEKDRVCHSPFIHHIPTPIATRTLGRKKGLRVAHTIRTADAAMQAEGRQGAHKTGWPYIQGFYLLLPWMRKEHMHVTRKLGGLITRDEFLRSAFAGGLVGECSFLSQVHARNTTRV